MQPAEAQHNSQPTGIPSQSPLASGTTPLHPQGHPPQELDPAVDHRTGDDAAQQPDSAMGEPDLTQPVLAIKADPEAADEQADLPADAAAAEGGGRAVKLEGLQEDEDAFEIKPKKPKERGVLTSDVHARTVESCKPILAQASDILVGPEFDRKTGGQLLGLDCGAALRASLLADCECCCVADARSTRFR